MGTTTATASTVAAPSPLWWDISTPVSAEVAARAVGPVLAGAVRYANDLSAPGSWSGGARPPGAPPGAAADPWWSFGPALPGGVWGESGGVPSDTSGISGIPDPGPSEMVVPGVPRRILAWMRKPEAVRRHLPTSPFKAKVEAPRKHFALGDRVTHDAYGLGRVIGVEGEAAVLVDFGSRQERITEPFTGMFNL